jgi:hypothetical protein
MNQTHIQTLTPVSKETFSSPLVRVICEFLSEIGLKTQKSLIEEDTFLPGLFIDEGIILIDEKKLLYPGDILHEAGHLAVLSPSERMMQSGKIGDKLPYQEALGNEIMAIAWSYAACIEIGLMPEVVFHPYGYKGAASWYLEQYKSKNYLGANLLQWVGMCYDEKNAALHETKPYPYMIKWKR